MSTVFLDKMETMVAVFILTALSAYILFAYYEFKTTKDTVHVHFASNAIAFSILWIFECMLIVLFYFFKEASVQSRRMLIIEILAFIIIIAVIAAVFDFIRKKRLQPIPFIPINLFLSAAVLLLIHFRISINTIFHITLTIYVIICFIFGLETSRRSKRATRAGLFFTLLGAVTLIIANSQRSFWGFSFMRTIDLGFAVLLNVGFFLYYCEVYSISISEKICNIRQKNKELTQAEKRISYLAYVDQVTRLKNTYKLQEEIHSLDASRTYLLVLNLGNFRIYNNFAGYEKGNKVLLGIAYKLKEILNGKGELYRFYSAKFIILHTGDSVSAEALAQNVLKELQSNTFCAQPLMPYIGITGMSEGQKNFDCLIQELELASQYAKKNGLEYTFYDKQWYRELQQQLDLETSLRRAVLNKEWEMYFQPKIGLKDNNLLGAEALIRWKNHEGQISPQVFIPLSERLGLIQEIGSYVIETAFDYVKTANEQLPRRLNISINLSPFQLMEREFPGYVAETLEKKGIDPSQITFEITESALMNNLSSVNDAIMHLKRMGFRFSLDDFGTGYSSLHYFSELNLDEIKFDKTFTNSLSHNDKNRVILRDLTKMAQKLGIHIVVEGVETREQYECIKKLGCDAYQGFLYSRPVPFDDFISLVNR